MRIFVTPHKNPNKKRLSDCVWDAIAPSFRFFRGLHYSDENESMKQSVNQIKELLTADMELSASLNGDPTVVVGPYRRSDSQTQIVVWLPFREEIVTRHNLISAIHASIKAIIKQSDLCEFEQACIGIVVGDNYAGEGRILLVLVDRNALASVQSLTDDDFLGQQDATYEGWFANAVPTPGVRVSWYRNPIQIPK